jgi:hypothetical protein
MRHEMATTRNVRRFLASVRELSDRPPGVEGMGLLWGAPGEGKSTVIAYATNMLDGVFLRAGANWTVTTMLQALCVELGLAPSRFRAPMVDAAVARLSERQRPIFVDEADYLLRQAVMLDTLRDIYDVSGAPVVLIGMEQAARKIQQSDYGRFARRITQWIEFRGIDLADARTLADTVCEVPVADDLMAHVHKAAAGNIGRMVTALSRIEAFGRNSGLRLVDSESWADRPMFYDQPRFARRAH